MSSTSWVFSPSAASTSTPSDPLSDYRSRLALEQFQAFERRQVELAEQRSALNTPCVRIRAWEKVHSLKLPADAAHPVLRAVAAATHLTLGEVREEQRRRSEQVADSKPAA